MMKKKKKDAWKCTEKKKKVKKSIYQSKKKVNEHFGRKMSGAVNGNRKLFWKEVSNAKGGKVENCRRLKDGNGTLTQGEDEVRRICKEYFEDLYNIDIQEEVAITMCGISGNRRGNHFGGEVNGRAVFSKR